MTRRQMAELAALLRPKHGGAIVNPCVLPHQAPPPPPDFESMRRLCSGGIAA